MLAGMLNFKGKRVAIVGNAPTALQNQEDIDGFDIVVRFNRFQLGRGFEALGTKTDVLVLPVSYTKVINRDLTKHLSNVPFILDVSHSDKRQRRLNAAALREMFRGVKIIDAHATAIAMRDELLKAEFRGKLKLLPTSGASAMSWFLRSEAAEIYLTGFSFEQARQDHYFPDPRHPFDYTCHCPIKELHWIAQRAHRPGLRFDEHIRRKLFEGQPCDEVAAAERRNWQPYSSVHRGVYEKAKQSICAHAETTRRVPRALEIGAGIGFGADLLRAYADLTLVEPNPRCQQHLHTKGWAAMKSLDEVTGTFDVATCIEVLEHLPPIEVPAFLRRIRDLAPWAIFSTPNRKKNAHGRRTVLEWKHTFAENGWASFIAEEQSSTLYFEAMRCSI